MFQALAFLFTNKPKNANGTVLVQLEKKFIDAFEKKYKNSSYLYKINVTEPDLALFTNNFSCKF